MLAVRQSAAARRDLIDHYVYLAEEAGLNVAERFLAQAQAGFALLAQQPAIGAPLQLRHPELAGLRKWRLKDFDHHLVFYKPYPDSVLIVRVLHAASDWWGLLGMEAHDA